jgi:uncharacterized protein
VVVVIVDTPERVAAFLPQLDDLIAEGTAVVDDVDLIRFGAPGPGGTAAGAEGEVEAEAGTAPGGDAP